MNALRSLSSRARPSSAFSCLYSPAAALAVPLLLMVSAAGATAGGSPTGQAPATPASVTVTRGDGTLTASWPAVEGAASYHVTYSSDGGGSWSLAALNHPDASITITGVDNAKSYLVGVRARNEHGDSGWRNSPTADPYMPPSDDETAPVAFAALSIADASADEGDALSFTVTLDKAVPGGFTVTPTLTDGVTVPGGDYSHLTATRGNDYRAEELTLDFTGTAGETLTFSVPTIEDREVEYPEVFTVGLSVSGTSHRVTATDTATGIIYNDDVVAAGASAASSSQIKDNGSSITLYSPVDPVLGRMEYQCVIPNGSRRPPTPRCASSTSRSPAARGPAPSARARSPSSGPPGPPPPPRDQAETGTTSSSTRRRSSGRATRARSTSASGSTTTS